MKYTKADRMCYSKRRYPSMIAAFCAIGKIKFKFNDAACTDLRPYECPICAGWHLTKAPQDNPEYQKRRWMAGLS